MTLDVLEERERELRVALETSGATNLVKGLQAIRLQRAVQAVGIFSIFEAMVQTRFGKEEGFQRVRRILDEENETECRRRFDQCYAAINALKHGYGRSYGLLLDDRHLPFRVKRAEDGFFFEGDVSEANILVDADDAFVRTCIETIAEVSVIVERASC